MVEFLKEAARVVPSKRQLDWFEMERYAFVHYGVNTYTDREWGEGTEDEKIFNPTALDCDQWVVGEVCGPQGTHPHGEAPRRFLPVAEQIHGAQREKQPL